MREKIDMLDLPGPAVTFVMALGVLAVLVLIVWGTAALTAVAVP